MIINQYIDGIAYPMTAEELEALRASIRPPQPVPARILSVLQFRDRLSAEEELAITAAGMASAAVRVWLDRLAGAQEVNLDDPRTVAGLHAMAAAGLLFTERVTEILA